MAVLWGALSVFLAVALGIHAVQLVRAAPRLAQGSGRGTDRVSRSEVLQSALTCLT